MGPGRSSGGRLRRARGAGGVSPRGNVRRPASTLSMASTAVAAASKKEPPVNVSSLPVLGFAVLAACSSTSAALMQGGNGEKRPMEIADFYRCATVGAPALSRDGAKVAFSVRRYELEAGKSWSEIWMMDADGKNLRQMTGGKNNDTEPSFSPDGKTLLFVSARDGGGQLWTMAVDGGEPKKLTDWAP